RSGPERLATGDPHQFVVALVAVAEHEPVPGPPGGRHGAGGLHLPHLSTGVRSTLDHVSSAVGTYQVAPIGGAGAAIEGMGPQLFARIDLHSGHSLAHHQHERIVSHQRCADLALAVVLPGRHRCGGDVLHLSPRAHSGLLGWDDHDPEQDEHDGAARPESRASPQVRGPAFTWRRGASIAIAAAAAAVTSPLIGSARPAGAAGSATTAGL